MSKTTRLIIAEYGIADESEKFYSGTIELLYTSMLSNYNGQEFM